MFAVEITIFHTHLSKLPAFEIIFIHCIQGYFNIHNIQSTDNHHLINSDRTELMVAYDVLDLSDSIRVYYDVTVATDAPDDAPLNITSNLYYTNLHHMPQGLAFKVKFNYSSNLIIFSVL